MTETNPTATPSTKSAYLPNSIKDISQLIFLIGLIFYFFGFITLNSYWAQFGIITFDVMNSRFIVAGIFAVIAVFFALLFAWASHKQLEDAFLFEHKTFQNRIGTYILFYAEIQLFSSAVTWLFNLGKVSKEGGQLKFKSLGEWDFIGKWIEGWNITQIAGIEVFKIVFYGFIVSVIVLLFIYLGVNVYSKSKKNKSKKEDKKEKKEAPAYVAPKNRFSPRCFFMDLAELVALTLLLFIFFSSLKNLLDNRFTLVKFNENPTLDQSLVYSWLFTTSVGFFLIIRVLFSKRSFKRILENLNDFELIRTTRGFIQILIIPTLTGLILFGQTIFPRICFGIGGGEPRKVHVELSNRELVGENDLFQIGESKEFVFLVTKNSDGYKALQINKSEIKSINTENDLLK